MILIENSFGGMNLLWWFIWVIVMIWIFAIPYNIPGQRLRKDSPLDLLKKRFASGQINQQQYFEIKFTLEKK